MIFAWFLSMIPWGCTLYCRVHSCGSGARFRSGWFRMIRIHLNSWIRIRICIQNSHPDPFSGDKINFDCQLEISTYEFFFHLFKIFLSRKEHLSSYYSRLLINIQISKSISNLFLQNVAFLTLGSGAGSEFKLFWKWIRILFLYKETQRDGEYK